MNTRNPQLDHFDGIVVGCLLSPDFAQPKHDLDYYKSRSVVQIECAISNISKATTQSELIASIASAMAFVEAAHNLDFIDFAEKLDWDQKITNAYQAQVLEA